jgi:ubiquinone/menaquinone biosynthesis C-methylase UbiE
MDTPEEARDYDGMDHSEVNRLFVADLLSFVAGQGISDLGDTLDVGTGTALIPIELCRTHPACRVMAIDMAVHMLDLARYNIEAAGLTERISLAQVDAKAMPFRDGMFAAVVSNSIVHHIPEPWACLKEMVRVTHPDNGLIFVRDLLRPADDDMVNELVQTYAGNENAHSRQMFDDSLRAALSLDEIRELVSQLGFDENHVKATSDRHWTWAANMTA